MRSQKYTKIEVKDRTNTSNFTSAGNNAEIISPLKPDMSAVSIKTESMYAPTFLNFSF